MLFFLKKDAGDIFFEAESKLQKVGSESILQVERFVKSGHAIPIYKLSVCIAGDT